MLNQSTTLDLTFRALADPARRVMLDRLAKGRASVSELAAPLEMSLPAVVQHLAVLEEAGLVHSTKVGRVRTCSLEPKPLFAAQSWIAERRDRWARHLEALDRYLADAKPAKTGRRPRR